MRKGTWQLALAGAVALAACGTENDDVAMAKSTLSDGVQAVCQDCQPHDSAVKLVNTNNGRSQNAGVCSGTMITTNRVLTSAKCLTDNAFHASRVCITNRVRDPACDFGAPISELYYVRQTFIHPSFTGVVGAGFDAAIVQLERPVTGFPISQPTNTTIARAIVDDQVFQVGTQGTDFGFGSNTSDPNLNGQKQVRSDVPSIASSFPNYIALQSPGFLAGDFGGGYIRGFNQIAGINSFVQNGVSFLTRTQPILGWVSNPGPAGHNSTPNCTMNGRFLVSTIAGKCLQSVGTSGVTLAYCECKNTQRWLTPVSGNGQQLLNLASTTGTSRCLTAPGTTGVPTLDICSGVNTQSWQIAGGITQTQINASSGPMLLTENTNTPFLGSSSAPHRWWELR